MSINSSPPSSPWGGGGASLRTDELTLQDNHGNPIMGFALTSAGGFAETSSSVPSRAFLENLENFNDQAKRLTEGDEKLVGTSFEVIPKLFRTRFAEGSQPARPDPRINRGFQGSG